jgi:hypothetical protein
MPESRRYYRKNLKSHGFVYLAGEEFEIVVKNLSITGLLVELKDRTVIRDVSDLFRAIKLSPLVDLYIIDMRLAGEAEIVRADMVDDSLLLAMEFVHVYYDIVNIFYKRKAYRKSLASPGQIFLKDRKYMFKTINVSVEGLMIYIDEKISVQHGVITTFEFKRLDLLGEIQVIWVEDDPEGGTLMGLQYIRMEKEKIKGIPRFAQHFEKEQPEPDTEEE